MSQWVKALATELELDPQDPQVEENKLKLSLDLRQH